jgi:hypothetical protein
LQFRSSSSGVKRMEKEWVFEEIQVECYSGYKGEESPRTLVYSGKRHEIAEILDRWYEGNLDPTALRHDYFKVKTTDEEVFLIRYTPRYQSWTLCRRLPALRSSDN